MIWRSSGGDDALVVAGGRGKKEKRNPFRFKREVAVLN